ncbi:hypothetical protein GUITHDRAFT_149513, partial [Guillardia theta CCMP2712]
MSPCRGWGASLLVVAFMAGRGGEGRDADVNYKTSVLRPVHGSHSEMMYNSSMREEMRKHFDKIPQEIKNYIDQAHDDWVRILRFKEKAMAAKQETQQEQPSSSSNYTFEQRLRGWALRSQGGDSMNGTNNATEEDEEEVWRQQGVGGGVEGIRENMLNDYLRHVNVEEVFAMKNATDLAVYSEIQSLIEDIDFVGNVSSHYTYPLVSIIPHGPWLRPSDQLLFNAEFPLPPIHQEGEREEETFANFVLALLSAKEGGCIMLDSFSSADFPGVPNTFPVTLAISVPVWCCLLNRLVLR